MTLKLTRPAEHASGTMCEAQIERGYDAAWYVLFVRSNQERMVSCRLEYFGIDYCLPTYPVLRQWKDRTVKLHRPLFPGYIFIHIPLVERTKVLMLPNVVSLVGTRSAPAVIAEDEIARIRAGVERANAEPHPYLRLGERVFITEGVLAGTEGVLVNERRRTRVVIAVEAIHRAFSVEVDATAIRSVSGCGVCAPEA